MAGTCLKAHFLQETWAKSSHPQQHQNKSQCPDFLFTFKVPYFGNHKQPLSSHPSSLACSWLLTHLRLPLGTRVRGPAQTLAMQLLWLQGPTNALASVFTQVGRERHPLEGHGPRDC